MRLRLYHHRLETPEHRLETPVKQKSGGKIKTPTTNKTVPQEPLTCWNGHNRELIYDLAMNRQPNKIVTTYTAPSLKVTTPKTAARNNTVVIDTEDSMNPVTSMPESLSDTLEPCSKRNKKSNILSHKHAMKQSKKKAFNNGSHESIIPKIKVITQPHTQIKDKTSEPINEESSKTLPQLKDETGSKKDETTSHVELEKATEVNTIVENSMTDVPTTTSSSEPS